MTEVTWAGGSRSVAPQGGGPSSTNLADLLERILDKGIVIVGDIRVNLLDIELLTIKLRLLVASVDKAKEMGIDWWEHDPTLSSKQSEVLEENRRLRERLAALEGGDGASSDGARLEEGASSDEGAAALEPSDADTATGARKTTGGTRKAAAGGRRATGGARKTAASGRGSTGGARKTAAGGGKTTGGGRSRSAGDDGEVDGG